MLKLSNREARWAVIAANGLATAPTGQLDLPDLIDRLGYVQLDTIRTVSRAHHHILWSRNQNYREPMLWRALKRDRALFEHFTHDASLLPMEMYPVWRWQFERMQTRFSRSTRWVENSDLQKHIRERIAAEGPLSTHAFDTKITGKKEMWARPPHKRAMDYMWYVGELTTCHRENFTKFYDLAERVIPADIYKAPVPDDPLDVLCKAALARLWVATPGEIQDFWGAASAAEVKGWLARADVVPVEMAGAGGGVVKAFALQEHMAQLDALSQPTKRLRILSPFDPLVRNRKRLERLFGFEYRIEIFVPEAERRWGYYVFPILEGDRFVGRIEVKADRAAGQLNVLKVWQETGVRWGDARDAKLAAELQRMARFIGVDKITWA